MKINVLVIEDNPGDANLIRIYLKEGSVKNEFFHAETLYEGIEIIETQHIDIVLLDLKLPDSSGFRTLMNFKARATKTPVIVLTGLDDEDVGNQAIKAGAQDYLVKGKQLDSNILARSLRYSMQRHKTQSRLEDTAKRLSISEKRFIEAQEMAHFGNWEIDIVTNEMTWADEVYRIFGFLPQSISPTLSDYLEYIHIEDRDIVNDAFEDAIKDGQLHKVEYRIVVDGTRIKYLSNQFQISTDEYTQKILLVGAVQDISEQKQAQALLEEKNLSEKTSKIKEEILEDLSFNIRTPLSSIINFTHLLDDKEYAGDENLGNLKESVDSLSIAVNNLLNFSILHSERISVEENEFNVNEVAKRLRQLVQIKADIKSISLETEIDEALDGDLHGDENKIQQILYNLLDNAIKYTAETGLVKLQIEKMSSDANEVFLRMSVIDNGPGITPAKIEELQQAEKLLLEEHKDSKQRSLGMAIVNRLTKNLGGQITIDSKVGAGSTFIVELPLKVAKATVQRVGEKPVKDTNILLVEDHFLNQIATKKILTKWSEFVSVEIADNGKIGAEKFTSGAYDIVLMDLQMPVMNGFEAAEEIRKSSKTPIIALSANTTKQEAEKCKEAGMNDYLAKPFKPDDLFNKIMNLLY
ncbi:MAG: response regulator [Bacteroidota bacterium]